MKFSAEILLTVLMGSLLCFQLALAQCVCKEKNGCCCPEASGCYFHMNSTVTNYDDAEKLCDTLDLPLEDFDARLPDAVQFDIYSVLECCYSHISLPIFFYAQEDKDTYVECPLIEVTEDESYVYFRCKTNEEAIVICVANCEC
ncbi:UNVERIFIED_CONTAM: hypothetical protein RMT77_008941 [Armadillidium vulgare]